MKLNLLVLRSDQPEKLKEQYEQLGFSFQYHRHGKGPWHYSAETEEGFVFEIYPLKKTQEHADPTLRLGFDVENLDVRCEELSTWSVLQKPSMTDWGYQAIVQDLDGRKVELIQQNG